MKKTCIRCKETKLRAEFNGKKTSGDKLKSHCKACDKIENASYSIRQRINEIYKKYNLTPEQYEDMLGEQNYCCPICTQAFTKPPHVDHDHATEKVRALLCGSCNRLLGLAYDSKQTLTNAVAYLEKHSG